MGGDETIRGLHLLYLFLLSLIFSNKKSWFFRFPFASVLFLFFSSSFSSMLREVTAARPALGALGASSASARPAAAAPFSARKMALGSASPSSSGGRSPAHLQRVRAISTEQPPVVRKSCCFCASSCGSGA